MIFNSEGYIRPETDLFFYRPSGKYPVKSSKSASNPFFLEFTALCLSCRLARTDRSTRILVQQTGQKELNEAAP